MHDSFFCTKYEASLDKFSNTQKHYNCRGEIEKYKEEVASLKQQLQSHSDPINIPSMSQSHMMQSVMPIQEGQSPAERISLLEQVP